MIFHYFYAIFSLCVVFHLPAIMNNAAIKLVCKHLLESLLSLIWVYTKKWSYMVDNMIILCLIFWGTVMLFSTVEIPFYSSTSNEWKFQLLHILRNTYYLLLFNNSHTNSIKWYLILLLICNFLMIREIEHLFMFFITVFIYSSNKIIFNSLLAFRNLTACVLPLLSYRMIGYWKGNSLGQ